MGGMQFGRTQTKRPPFLCSIGYKVLFAWALGFQIRQRYHRRWWLGAGGTVSRTALKTGPRLYLMQSVLRQIAILSTGRRCGVAGLARVLQLPDIDSSTENQRNWASAEQGWVQPHR